MRALRAGSQARARYTLEYASPEVIRAVGAMRAHYVECKPSMDIWSLGVIIFEARALPVSRD
jgi:serine/threonine protein kinase